MREDISFKFKKAALIIGIFTSSFILVPRSTYAINPFNSQIKGDIKPILEERFATSRAVKKSKANFSKVNHRFSVKIPDQGMVNIVFNKAKSKDWKAFFVDGNGERKEDLSKAALLRGKVFRRSGGSVESFSAAGSVYESKSGLTFKINFSLPRRSTSQKSGYEVTVKNGEVSLARAPHRLLNRESCGTEIPALSGAITSTEESAKPAISLATTTPPTLAATYREVELSAIGDFEFYTTFGSDSANRMASIMNSSEAIYERDLGVTYNVKSIYVYSTSSQPFNSNNASILLQQMTSARNDGEPWGTADLYHLFTTRNIFAMSGSSANYSVVGLAYLGVVCDPDFPYGVTERVSNSLDYIIFAHEIGHNFGASHDNTTSPSTIMVSVLPPSSESFSATSQNQITSYLTDVNYSCLTTVNEGTPTPTPTATATATGTPATPTPTATPTAPSGGGSGSDPTPESTIAAPSISASISTRGAFSTKITLVGGDVSDSCSAIVDFDSTGQFRSNRYESINLGGLTSRSTRETAQIKFKAIPPRGKKIARVYLRARYTCSGATKVSRMISLRTDRISAKRSLTAAKWVKRLFTTLSQ